MPGLLYPLQSVPPLVVFSRRNQRCRRCARRCRRWCGEQWLKDGGDGGGHPGPIMFDVVNQGQGLPETTPGQPVMVDLPTVEASLPSRRAKD